MRKVFFSFEYSDDIWRAMNVRNSGALVSVEEAGFVDKADFEKVEKEGDQAIKEWIDDQLKGTSVTVVLVGKYTCSSKWVEYEIEKSKEIGNGLLGIDISTIKNKDQETSEKCGEIPYGYDFYCWNEDNGFENMGDWIEKAATDAGR